MTELRQRLARLTPQQRAALEARLRRSAGPGDARIPRRPVAAGPPPLSYGQQRLWFMEQFAPGTGAYASPMCLRLRGELDVSVLTRSLDQVLTRHECLRSRFPVSEDGTPTVLIADAESVRLRTVDLSDTGTDPVSRAKELASVEAASPFDLRHGPLLRASLLRLADNDHVLLLNTHHIVSDGWSNDVLADEVFSRYESYTGGEPSRLPPLPVQYGDYAAWQRERLSSGGLEPAREYWRSHLTGLPPLELPTDHPRSSQQTFTGGSHHFRLKRPLVEQLERLARSHGATLYMVLLAGFQTLLFRHTGQRDFAVGSPVAGRIRPELERLIGLFVNMLPMRADLGDNPTFRELLARARARALDAWAHQELPFEQLVQEIEVDRDPSRSPVFQTALMLQNHPNQATMAARQAGGLRITRFPFDLRATRYDLELYGFPVDGGLDCIFVYNSDLFAPQRIGWLSGHLRSLLESAVANPDTRVSELDMLTGEELADAARRNNTATDLGEPECLHRLVLAQAQRTPDAVAVRDAHGTLTYRELRRRARSLAAELRTLGARPGELVAVVMERGAEQVVAVLAIQLAGAAYLPVDPDLPRQRRWHLLERGRCRTAVTQTWLADRLDWPDGLTVLQVTDRPDKLLTDDTELADPAMPDDLGYVIFTSGSTGDPKGVMIDHRAAVNTVRDMNRRFRVAPSDQVLGVSALSFDLSVWDIFGTLAAGGTLMMPEPAASKDPAAWARWVSEHRITIWDSVPALMELLVEHAEQEGTDISSLRLVLLSGDWIPLDLPDRIRALAPEAQVISLGGATEGSIWSIWHPVGDVDPAWRSIPYGTPLANQSFHILDAHGNPVPVGVTGELHIGGAGVARGYWRDPERTDASFFTHPRLGKRLYRTGDLGRYRPDGVIEFLGRVDAQVKIRGYRIELGEIEAHLSGCPGVAECVVTVLRQDGEQVLVGYVVPRDGSRPAPAELRAELARGLPGYMVPSHYVVLERLPLTGNGKVDRKRLPAPEAVPQGTREVAEPATDTERTITEVWRRTLGVDTIGLDDNFFDLGGHSLSAIQAVTRIRREMARDNGSELPGLGVTDLFRHPTVRELAAALNRPHSTVRRTLHELTPPERAATRALSFVCVPYGGGQPLVYQPLADALPEHCSLYAVAIPGHDPGLPEESAEPVDEVARRCAEEIMEHVNGPLVIYGHCGVGGAVAVALAQRLEAAGRELAGVCLGGIFPFARPGGQIVGPLSRLVRFDRLGGNRAYQNRLRAMGADLDGLESEQVDFMVKSLRKDNKLAEEYFTGLLGGQPARLAAPVISVVGERDPATDFYAERYREWHFLTDRTGLVILDEAGHYFPRYREAELAEILTRVPDAVARRNPAGLTRAERGSHPGWWLEATADAGSVPNADPADHWEVKRVDDDLGPGRPVSATPTGPRPGMARFLAVALSQLVSFTGTALTDFALPLWVYMTTGSLAQFAVFIMLAIIPGVATAPLIGALVDRSDRRTMMIVGNCLAGLTQLLLGLLVWTDNLAVWHTYPLVACLSVGLTFHRLGYTSAVPQLVPKQYLGHANGVVQLASGIAQFVAPLAAVALLATIGLGGILVFDVVSFAVAIAVIWLLRFPASLPYTPKEPLATEIAQGFRMSLGNPSFRAMIGFFALLNVLLAPLLMSLMPISLTIGDLSTAGTVAFLGGGGATLGGLVVALWGGPARRRMHGMLLASLLFGVFGVITGVHPSLLAVGLGSFGLWGTLSLVNGLYLTIIHIKLPQRYHGRVIALNQAVAWSTLPFGFAVVAPLGERLLTPLMAPDGALAPTVGALIGTGPGRGLALMYVLLGLAVCGVVLVAMRTSRLARFDDEVPDADPDDLVGARTLRERAEAAASSPGGDSA